MAAEYPSIFTGAAAPQNAAAPAYVYGGFGERTLAQLIDTVIHYAVSFATGITIAILAFFIEAIGGASAAATMERMGGGQTFISILGGFVAVLIYHTICEGYFGSTAGKYMLGLVVLNDDGTPCTVKAAFKRSLAFFVDSLFFGLIAWSHMKDSPEKKRIGDSWADTIVVKRASAPQGVLYRPLRFAVVFLAANALASIVIGVTILF